MQTISLVLLAGATGVFTGAAQLHLYLSQPDSVKPFCQHLDDLRAYVRAGWAVMTLVLLMVILYHPNFTALQLSAVAFALSWITVAFFGARSYLNRQRQPPA